MKQTGLLNRELNKKMETRERGERREETGRSTKVTPEMPTHLSNQLYIVNIT